MEYNRRTFLGTGALGVTALGRTLVESSPPKTATIEPSSRKRSTIEVPDYQIIYNWDGAPHNMSGFPQSIEQFLEKTYAPMKDTQVGAHFWCIGEHEAKWPSKTMEMAGDSQSRVYDSVRIMQHNEGVRAMFERQENPYQALVKRGHELGMHVYASIRMNDNHFGGLQVEDMANANLDGLTSLRKEHPEWCLGSQQTPKWFATSWNFSIPEVREHRLQHITEVCGLADWDGIELDWQRHGFHLPSNDAYRLRYTLTDLQRAVRRLTNRLGRERGNPLYLAVRVATTLQACHNVGYDLPTWVKEELCDIMIAGGGAGTDYGVEVESFVNLLKGSKIRFYPGFDNLFDSGNSARENGGFWGPHEGLTPKKEWHQALVRATAKGYWDRGADGMYVFNWYANENSRQDLLTTIGSSQTLDQTDKVYAALHRYIGGFPFSEYKVNSNDPSNEAAWVGADSNDRLYGETPVALYPTLTEEGPHFHIGIYDESVREARTGNLKSAELHVELKHYSDADRVEVKLDGKLLKNSQIRNVAAEDPNWPSDVAENSWFVWSLTPDQAAHGMHLVKVRLLKRDPRVRPPLVVQSVEVHISYQG